MISKNNYDIDWYDMFVYDPTSPSGIRWRKNKYSGIRNNILSVSAGQVAGTKQYRTNGKPSKWMVKVDGKNYSVSKIVYILVNGYVPNDVIIDHIDRNPFNNNINNLRAVSENENLKNKEFQRNNTTGFTGVTTRSDSSGIIYFVAFWSDKNGKQTRKNFNVRKLGYIQAKIAAILYRYEMVKTDNSYFEQHFNCLEEIDAYLLEQSSDYITELENKLSGKLYDC